MTDTTGTTALFKIWATAVERPYRPPAEMDLRELGDLHRALRAALGEVEDALAPKIVEGAQLGETYVELAVAAGYGSTTTISKIMRDQAASPGRGSNQRRRASAA